MKTGRKSPEKAESPAPAGKPANRKTAVAKSPAGRSVAKDAGKGEKAAPAPVQHQGSGRAAAGSGAGRAFWSGSITIGLVSVPVRLHTMVRDHSFPFRLLHRSDGQPLRYDRVCSRDGVVVPWTDTIKGYEVRKGEFVTFEPAEIKAVMPESDRRIRIAKFVRFRSLDPMYFDNSYILVPDRSEEAYNLLLAVLTGEDRAAAGTITLRTKEYPVVVHAYGKGLVLTTLRYADEVVQPASVTGLADLPQPKETELALAKRIITELAGEFAITDYHDRFRDAVLSLVDKKLAGEKVVYEEARPEEAKELMQALRETLAALPKT